MATKTPVSQSLEAVEKKTFVQKLTDFIRRHRTPILAVSGSVIGAVIIIGVYSAVSNSRAESAAAAMEQVREKITSMSAEADEAKKAELKKALLADLDKIEKTWARSFPAQEAVFVKAGFAVQEKNYEDAEKGYLAAANLSPKSYLAPIALEAAAVAAEERGAADKAQEYYARIIKDYKDVTPNLAHAHFSLGRLAEGKSDWTAAVESYEKLVAAYPDSDWTKLAKDRIIYIKASGLVK